jgi:hypothetical protein
LVISACAILLLFVALVGYVAWSLFGTASVPVTVSPETTRITGPLRANGSVDYLAAINKKSSQGVTPENNAAVLIWQALGPAPQDAATRDEFFRELGIPTPPEEGDYFVPLDAFVPVQPELLLQADEADDGPPQEIEDVHDNLDVAVTRPWTREEFPLLADWLQANEEPLAIVIEASKRPRLYAPLFAPQHAEYPCMDAECVTADKSRLLAQALAARAMMRSSAGQIEEAWQDLMAAHRLSRLVMQGPTLVDGLLGIAINKLACATEEAFVDHVTPQYQRLASMQAELDKLPSVVNLVSTLDEYERYVSLDVVGCASVGASNEALGSAGRFVGRPVDWNVVLRRVNDQWDRYVVAMRLPARVKRHSELDAVEQEILENASAVKTVRGTVASLLGSRSTLSRNIADVFVALMLPPLGTVSDIGLRAQMEFDLTRLSFALAAYRADHGAFPGKLDDLVPKYIAKVPDDVFVAGPIQYTTTGDGCILHSVGIDGHDDGVPAVDAADEDASDDLIVRLGSKPPEPRQP